MAQIIDINTSRELRALKNDMLMMEKAVQYQQNAWKEKLKGGVGEDIDDVLSGRVKVKLTWKEKLRYKWRYLKAKFRRLFRRKEREDFYDGI